jgi:type IV secretion system protein VirD4
LLKVFFSQLVNLDTRTLSALDPSLQPQCLLANDAVAAMGRVGLIVSTAAFLAGYNLRLLTVVQAMSQLDAVHGDKDARTFATNHGLQQEFKELGSERLVAIFENCKPILAEKIRYHRDKVFAARLRRPPRAPRMDVELHLARVQQRWRYADDELAPGQTLCIEALAVDISRLPDPFEGSAGDMADTMMNLFPPEAPGAAEPGRSIDRTCCGRGRRADRADADARTDPALNPTEEFPCARLHPRIRGSCCWRCRARAAHRRNPPPSTSRPSGWRARRWPSNCRPARTT